MTSREAFKFLGLEPGVTPAEVQAAYKRLAFRAHPDHGGSPEQFEELNQAAKAARDYALSELCHRCHGSCRISTSRGFHTVWQTCQTCGGTGRRHL